MFRKLGYKIDLFENYSIADDYSRLVLGGVICSEPTCSSKCYDCRDGCHQGPDPNPGTTTGG